MSGCPPAFGDKVAMSLASISVNQAKALLEKSAVLIDIREPHEFKAEHIVGSLLHPLSALPAKIETNGMPVIFLCKSGMRTNAAAHKLSPLIKGNGYILTGGLNAWKQAGEVTSTGDRGIVGVGSMFGWLLSSLRGK